MLGLGPSSALYFFDNNQTSVFVFNVSQWLVLKLFLTRSKVEETYNLRFKLFFHSHYLFALFHVQELVFFFYFSMILIMMHIHFIDACVVACWVLAQPNFFEL